MTQSGFIRRFLPKQFHKIATKSDLKTRAGSGLQNAGSGRALHCGLGLFAGLGDYLVKWGSGFY
jgi:hypothetical protein